MEPVASCFMLGLKETQVTVSLWPLKCLSRPGSSYIGKEEEMEVEGRCEILIKEHCVFHIQHAYKHLQRRTFLLV